MRYCKFFNKNFRSYIADKIVSNIIDLNKFLCYNIGIKTYKLALFHYKSSGLIEVYEELIKNYLSVVN